MDSVLACVDFTHDPDGVARVGGRLADRIGARLVLATILPPPASMWMPAGAAAAPVVAAHAAAARTAAPDVIDSIRDDEAERLTHLAAEHGLDAVHVCVGFSVDAADALRQVAVDERAVLLVVGATRHRGLGAALLGSTSHALCAHAPCPVVVVPGDLSEHGDGTA
jgi:nucleotide-binding universal stress UspA family protein